MIAYLSKAQVLRIHERKTERFGGTPGLRNEAGLESALARPQATYGGEDLHPTVVGKAAALLHALASNHRFVDGNKRTAVMAAEFFLRVDGFSRAADDNGLEEVTMSVARGELDSQQIEIWLDQRIRELR